MQECVYAKWLQPYLTLCNPMDYSPPGSSCPWDSPGKNTGEGCHFLLQGIFQAQGSNSPLLCLLHWQAGYLLLVPMQETQVQSLGQEDALEKETATHSTLLAREVPWTEETGRLWSTGSQKSQT